MALLPAFQKSERFSNYCMKVVDQRTVPKHIVLIEKYRSCTHRSPCAIMRNLFNFWRAVTKAIAIRSCDWSCTGQITRLLTRTDSNCIPHRFSKIREIFHYSRTIGGQWPAVVNFNVLFNLTSAGHRSPRVGQ